MLRRLLNTLIGAVIVGGTLVVLVPAEPVAAVANPPIADSCGVDVTLALDASGSIQSANAVDTVRNAADSFLDSLVNTNSTARVLQFGTLSEQLAPRTLIDTGAVGAGGVLRNAINGYYNPKPPRPSGTNLFQYTGSNPASAGSFTLNNNSSSNQYTNWDATLEQTNTERADLMVFITDGDPTAYEFRGGDPHSPPHVAFGTDRNTAGSNVTLQRAVDASDLVKGSGTRMLTIGVGSALSNANSVARLVAVTGPQVVRDADLDDITSLNQVDVALVTDFDDLAEALRGIVLQLCSPSLTIRKLAQTDSNATYLPAPGWDMTVTPTTLTSGTFDWILPDAIPAASKTVSTDTNGFAQFQWEPTTPAEQNSSAHVSEAIEPGFIAGRAGDDARCELRDEDGNLRLVNVANLTVAGGNASFDVPLIRQEIVTCTIWNSFVYQPQIELTKVNTPTAVRGDLTPPAQVTSAYAVTTTGNAALSNVTVIDDKCTNVVATVQPTPNQAYNVGDVDRDGMLDPARASAVPPNPAEQWQFTCTRTMTDQRRIRASTPLNVVNTATAAGVDPAGTRVTDTATDDVDVYIPDIEIEKLVDGERAVVIQPGDTVDYTYTVTNPGNSPLGSVSLVDDTPPCTSPVLVPSPATADGILAPGEIWNYTCLDATPDTSASTDVTNTATVTGTPLNPQNGSNPFPIPNPVVTDADSARVLVVATGIGFTKSVSPAALVLGPLDPPNPPSTAPVTYTFTATNAGSSWLSRPGATTPSDPTDGTLAPGWVRDSTCSSAVTYASGDANDNFLIDPAVGQTPAETWTFTCAANIEERTVNIAAIVADPTDSAGASLPLPDVGGVGSASVDALRPGIDIEKTTSTPVVLSDNLVAPAPGAPFAGPDIPPRPAAYEYLVANIGEIPLVVTVPTDDTCSPVTPVLNGAFNIGDANADGLLDVPEVWTYTCSTTLNRLADSNVPPAGDESGSVTNTARVTAVPAVAYSPGITPAPPDPLVATDTETVSVIEPGITLTKTVSTDIALVGDDVTYAYVVANTGDVGLTIAAGGDDTCSQVVPTRQAPPNDAFNIGDVNRNGLIDGANTDDANAGPESWTWTCTQPIGLPPGGATVITNTATVEVVGPLGNFFSASDTATVRVFDPAIHLTKTVSESLVPVGTTVTYDFAVTNTGASPVAADDVLADVVLIDAANPATPTCTSPAFVDGDVAPLGVLTRVPAETWRYRCSAPIGAPTVNIAEVTGTAGTQFQPPLPVDVHDFAAAFVQTFTPAIDITKSANPEALTGSGTVTYTYLVRNPGDVPLADIPARITDDTCAPVTYVSGDADGDGLLDTPNSIFESHADETWTFTCSTTISQTTTNTVVVTGTPTDDGAVALCAPPTAPASVTASRVAVPCDVTDQAQAVVVVDNVQPLRGSLTVTKVTTQATGAAFGFTSAGDTFSLRSGSSHTTSDLPPGVYTVSENSVPGWQLTRVTCGDAAGNALLSRSGNVVTVTVNAGASVTCTFTNRSTGSLPSTGYGTLRGVLAIGMTALAIGAGLVLFAASRRRRIRPTI